MSGKTIHGILKLLPTVVLALALTSLNHAAETPPTDWTQWHAKRLESVGGTNGWSTLVGLHWLEEGPNSAGSNSTNAVVLPAGRAPGFVGVFIRHGKSVRFEAANGVDARVAGRPIQNFDLRTDATREATRLQLGPLTILALERGERLALRVKDPEAPTRQHFTGLPCFPYDPKWRIKGRFEPFPEPCELAVPDVTGATQKFPSRGNLVFNVAGSEYRLQVVEEPDEPDYFVIFRDRTAGETTYGPGRFLYVTPPDDAGPVVIDFNRAYSPPCAFTPYATCPLPPRQNWLPFAINAGELKPSGSH